MLNNDGEVYLDLRDDTRIASIMNVDDWYEWYRWVGKYEIVKNLLKWHYICKYKMFDNVLCWLCVCISPITA